MDQRGKDRVISELQSFGFEGFVSVQELFTSCSDVPRAPGLYLVLYIKGGRPDFSPQGPGGFFKGRDPNVDISDLESRWIDDTSIVYIGQTGNSLHQRVSKLLKFGMGMPVGHYGGRYIWQIKDHQDLVVCWRVCPNEVDSREIERELLQRFMRIHGRLPFANIRE